MTARMVWPALALLLVAVAAAQSTVHEYRVPPGSRPHDVAPAADGGVWYTAQHAGALGWLDPQTGATRHIPLGAESRPHGVIVGPDGAPWITNSGLNAIVRVDPASHAVTVFAAPAGTPYMNLNTATFDGRGVLWFTGQAGYYGRLDPASGAMTIFPAPHGRGPYGICTMADGSVYYASLAGSHIARIDTDSGAATVIEPPTPGQGARRVWGDARNRVWVSEWLSGQLSRYDPADGNWRQWRLPGTAPQPYAVYVDAENMVWVSDFGDNTVVHFDPVTGQFTSLALPAPAARIRQILGRPGEVWLPASGSDSLVVIRTAH